MAAQSVVAEGETPVELSVGVVLYRPDVPLLGRTLASLAAAVRRAGVAPVPLILVDNSPAAGFCIETLKESSDDAFTRLIIRGHGNVGFGRGHNLALNAAVARFHLVLNPDVELEADALANALRFMRHHPHCALLSPSAYWPDGSRQHLCKRYPSVLALFLRGFAPRWAKRAFSTYLEHYEMRDTPSDETLWDPPIASGCFMLWRSEVLGRLGGFDPRYFLYFEDFDLCLRTARFGHVVRVPQVRIVHHGGRASSKGARHVLMFARSAVRFFGTHGWRWW